MFATEIVRWKYRHLAKPIFFRIDPEKTHDDVLRLGRLLGRFALARRLTSFFFDYRHPWLGQSILGIRFPNPIGLAAGFDKNAVLTDILPAVGFGFEEIGSITGEPCAGNAKPRLWRLPRSRGLVVYYGLKNDGCMAVAARLRNRRFMIPMGISVAKTNSPDTVDIKAGIADYAKAFGAFADIGDYLTVNISCPNAFGGEPFATPDRLDLLLAELDKITVSKPVFLKMPADISTAELDGLMETASRHRVHGLIISNLTKRRDSPLIVKDEIRGLDLGGISGKPLAEISNRLISHAYLRSRGRFVIIGCGGVFSAQDAYEKIKAGASLVQLITGMIYEGPQLIGEINRGLVKLLERDGIKNINEAIGKGIE